MVAEPQQRGRKPQPIYRGDYRPPAFLIDRVDLDFRLDESATEVTSRLALRRNPAPDAPRDGPLVLDGQDLELLGLALDGAPLPEGRYGVTDESLTLFDPPDDGRPFELEVRTRINPATNTALEGLYVSNGIFCTQCEAEGFRRITYFLDRPDVMARYRTRIEADAKDRVLLSNGNPVEEGPLGEGRHYAVWEDPFPKPCYLFALVAGDLAHLADTFVTKTGREVCLRVYAEARDVAKCAHAMESLKKSMRWDEDVFGLEYDLDLFMVVAIGDFNMGAMENKGLNVFNTKYVLADPETATDADYLGIEAVIAHEYFHNWTGNRVTCRDWFQLSLKEGLTVFRDQEFSSDMHSRPVKRISDVRRLRAGQFAEDAGPLAHPVRPDSYVEINNFYTMTVYDKGAEVVRMIHTLLGPEAFRRGMDLYLRRHDGQAVTCDDFVRAMEDASDRDLTQFRRWYAQAGTPRLTVTREHDPESQTFRLHIRQHTPATPGQPDKPPLHVPLALGLLDREGGGAELPLQLEGENAPRGTSRVLELREAEQTFTFVNIPRRPVPSLLRGFSAPVILEAGYGDDELRFLAAHEPDLFNRWEALQTLAIKLILQLVEDRSKGRPLALDPGFGDAIAATLDRRDDDPAFVAQALALPSEAYLGQQMGEIDVDGIHAAREFVRAALGGALRAPLLATYEAFASHGSYAIDARAIGRRSLRNLCLAYLTAAPDGGEVWRLCLEQFERADNMTDRIAALSLLAEGDHPARERALAAFYDRWRGEALVVDKWFSIQAMAQRPDAVETVRRLLEHPAFTIRNPNRVRSLLGAFAAGNPTGFHRADGAGYALFADQVLRLNALNPQVAARMLGAMERWRRHDGGRRALMRAELERILAAPDLSRDVYEIASRTLGGGDGRGGAPG